MKLIWPCENWVDASHTINTQLPDEHITSILNDAEDDALLVAPSQPVEALEPVYGDISGVEGVVVLGEENCATSLEPLVVYDELVEASETTYPRPQLSGDQKAGM